jgi:hypothetical protein
VKRLEEAFVAAGFERVELQTLIDIFPRPPYWSSKA